MQGTAPFSHPRAPDSWIKGAVREGVPFYFLWLLAALSQQSLVAHLMDQQATDCPFPLPHNALQHTAWARSTHHGCTQHSARSNQQSAISNQQSAISTRPATGTAPGDATAGNKHDKPPETGGLFTVLSSSFPAVSRSSCRRPFRPRHPFSAPTPDRHAKTCSTSPCSGRRSGSSWSTD